MGHHGHKGIEEMPSKSREKSMADHAPIPGEAEAMGRTLLDAAFEVHTALGAGFLERVYEDALCHEVALRNVPFERQKAVIVPYKSIQIQGHRLDLMIGGLIIAEIKAADGVHPIHQAQLMSYLKATGLLLGFVLNFNVPHLKEGICRVVL